MIPPLLVALGASFFLLPLPCSGTSNEISWIVSCASLGLSPEWLDDQPIPGSVAQELVTCMVEHVMTAPYTREQLVPLVPSPPDDWCVPDDFSSVNRTCASLRFDTYEPIRHCIEQENFPDLLSDTKYEQGFEIETATTSTTSSFYLSSRLTMAMCSLLDGLRTRAGQDCIIETCRLASHAPSSAPSPQPSVVPTLGPSQGPSARPSSTPSDAPSTVPSVMPSEFSSMAPSKSPSARPTPIASESPTVAPTVETAMPSWVPSLGPSWYPTLFPTMERTYGPGPFLQVNTTLRVLLDDAETLEIPLEEKVDFVLERAIQESVRSIPGYQRVDITEAVKALVPQHAPVVLTFRIVALQGCDDDGPLVCNDPYAPGTIARQFRDAFEEFVYLGRLEIQIRRQALRQNATSLVGVSPRANSSNLMSSNSYIVAPLETMEDVSLGYVVRAASFGWVPVIVCLARIPI